MNRQEYLSSLEKQLEPNILAHSLALEACMLGLYDYFQQNNLLESSEPTRPEWGIAGLVHDIDYSGDTKSQHPNLTRQVLKKYNLTITDTVDSIVKSHAPELTGIKPVTKAQWSIFCADSLTGLIVATALIYPTKKLSEVKLSSILKRFHHEPRFAAGTRRDEVKLCQLPNGLNISLDKFIEICLTSMQQISSQIGL
jgi:predicted hydrolase (HD superfamily)